ncbi:MAG: HNH endonuclease [Acutalibacteraceae bacterium]
MDFENMNRKKKKCNIREDIIKEWIEINGNQCPICGRVLEPANCVIDHIYPMSMGGTDEIANLQVLCKHCNAVKGNRPFLGYKFEEYIKNLLEANGKYTNVSSHIKIGDKVIDADIVFEEVNDKQKTKYIAEVSIFQSFTASQIQRTIKQLLEYKDLLPSATAVFITPSELPQKYVELIEQNGIELWDKTFLATEFREQILQVKPYSFRAFFDLSKNMVNNADEYQILINKLNGCPSGWPNWVDYQDLVGNILEFLFCPPLNSPIPQSNDRTKKNKRDFILSNYSKENDIWEFLRGRYGADYVVVDAKNSRKNISKNDVLQIANYLKKDGTGLFGIIIARKGTDSSSENTLRDMWIYQQKMIVVLNDTDIEQMILAKKDGENPARLILKKIEEFRLSI